MLPDKKVTAIVGHYGSGKTNIAINLARLSAKNGRKTLLCDLDIVNPYFRAADAGQLMKECGVEIENTLYANTNLDIPALTAGVMRAFSGEYYSILDIGGDDAGAVVLGRYKELFEKSDYDIFCVINQKRLLIETPEDAAQMVKDIEAAAKLKITGLINNTNLGSETTPELVYNSFEYAEKVSTLCKIPVVMTTSVLELEPEKCKNFFKIEILTKKYW